MPKNREDIVADQHRTTTAPVRVTDWKGEYMLAAGEGFTVLDLLPGSNGQDVNIERDGLLSGSMGGSMNVAEMLANSVATDH